MKPRPSQYISTQDPSSVHSCLADPRLAELVGYFHTVLPLVCTADGTRGMAHAVRSMHDSFAAAFQHTAISFQEIVAAVANVRQLELEPSLWETPAFCFPHSWLESLCLDSPRRARAAVTRSHRRS